MAYPPLGVQLIIFGGHFDADTQTDQMLDSVAKAGYTAFESGGTHAERFLPGMEAHGLKYTAAHVTLPGLENIPELVGFLRAVNSQDACNSGLLTWDNPGPDDYRQGAALLNAAGRALRSEGISLHYHNHAFEFNPLAGGGTGMDILLAELDPNAVDLCVDVAWVQKGGFDPAEFLSRHSSRVGYLHFKDYDDSLGGDGWTELGQGVVNFPAIMEVLPGLPHVRWAVVEKDSTAGDPQDSIAISRRYLQDTFGY